MLLNAQANPEVTYGEGMTALMCAGGIGRLRYGRVINGRWR